jgi:anti-sigma regulatory factor (Ser/Thr protein kinase)
VGESLTIEVRNTHEAIAPATEEAERWLEAHEVSQKAMYLALLAIEELVTNCIHYGYDDTAEHTIRIEFGLEDGELSMEVTDDGHEFDPVNAPDPDFALKLEDRPVGGLGIHMLRKMADEMTYERVDGKNRVRLVKKAGNGE